MYKYLTTEELGFTYPIETKIVTKKRKEVYNIDYHSLYSACNDIINYADYKNAKKSQKENHKSFFKNAEATLKRFIYSEISLYDKHFLGISNYDSTCAIAVPLENLVIKAKKLIKL